MNRYWDTVLTRDKILKAIEALDTDSEFDQTVLSLRLYRDRGEFDGTLESAIECLRCAEYEVWID